MNPFPTGQAAEAYPTHIDLTLLEDTWVRPGIEHLSEFRREWKGIPHGFILPTGRSDSLALLGQKEVVFLTSALNSATRLAVTCPTLLNHVRQHLSSLLNRPDGLPCLAVEGVLVLQQLLDGDSESQVMRFCRRAVFFQPWTRSIRESFSFSRLWFFRWSKAVFVCDYSARCAGLS
ncbi:hypothetical protein SAMN00790413_05182 [Deinococcus hopiensis KR-140]|uniref:Uncharacterized protein n=1 Tax=Deinococcus hopiensis KR-140 TaxID=695939 RepID=A0A1W1UTQ7_9DEIO|nr:hypothetical protein SAMN00790413_05182 [Deinococcus hopiensis KR-140]